jgi:thiosulfate/3-mercaptopyruvate sulfurtransferase
MRRTSFQSMLILAVSLLACMGAGLTLRGAPAPGPPVETQAQPEPAKPPVPAAAVMEPEELARILQSQAAEKPLIFQVGFRFLYKQAHIPGSEYLGPASKDEGLEQLRQRLAPVARTRMVVLYCGCCPWIKCPNVKPAYDALHGMGFTQVKVLRIEENFGANWVAKGFPTAKGE